MQENRRHHLNSQTVADSALAISAEGATPLHDAARRGDLKAVLKLLVECPQLVNVQTEEGETPLYLAAANATEVSDHLKIMELLVSYGANIHLSTPSGLTPLYAAAAEGGCAKAVEYLLIHDADPDQASTVNKWTPLFVALQNDFLDIAELLLEYGANPNAVCSLDGANPLILAAAWRRVEFVRLLLSAVGIDVNQAATNEIGTTALYAAANRDHVEVVRMLLAKGARVSKGTTGGFTTLHLAAQESKVKLFDLLLTAPDANLDQASHLGFTPLMLAVDRGQRTIVDRILARFPKVNLNAQNSEGETALFIAAEQGNTRAVGRLLEGGANPQLVRHSDRRTALHAAAVKGHRAVAKILIHKYPQLLNQRTLRGDTALFLASFFNHPRFVKSLLRLGADASLQGGPAIAAPPLYAAAFMGYDEVVSHLLTIPGLVNQPSADGVTPLPAAVYNKHYKIALWLIEHGADYNDCPLPDFRQLKMNITRLILDEEDEVEKGRLFQLVYTEGSTLNVFFKKYRGTRGNHRMFDGDRVALCDGNRNAPYPVERVETSECRRSL